MRRSDAYRVYLSIETATSLIHNMIFTVASLYEVTVAGLTPLELILVGTTLEASAFLFEVPTGVVADVTSRRLSVIIGFSISGLAFILEGSFPFFLPILLAQVLWGLGYTFTSGALQAWITDEIGEVRANKAFLTANRLGLTGAIAGMALAVLIGQNRVQLPILTGGVLLIVLSLILTWTMPETAFQPVATEARSSWQKMIATFRGSVSAVKDRPGLMNVLGVGFFYGAYSEGFDRLWTKHILNQFQLPVLFGRTGVTFFGALRAGGMLLAILATHLVEQRLDTSRLQPLVRLMGLVTIAISVGLIGFALSPLLGLATACYLLIAAMRNLVGPLYTAWINRGLDSSNRATILSMSSQMDAVGQIVGGPAAALVASIFSVPGAILTSALMILPALGLIARARRGAVEEDKETA